MSARQLNSLPFTAEAEPCPGPSPAPALRPLGIALDALATLAEAAGRLAAELAAELAEAEPGEEAWLLEGPHADAEGAAFLAPVLRAQLLPYWPADAATPCCRALLASLESLLPRPCPDSRPSYETAVLAAVIAEAALCRVSACCPPAAGLKGVAEGAQRVVALYAGSLAGASRGLESIGDAVRGRVDELVAEGGRVRLHSRRKRTG